MRPGEVRVGPYLLVREVARGGMGAVYEAQAPDGARVALKLLETVASHEALARFDRERRLLAELSSAAGFVPLLDAGEAQGRPWLVMPLMQGGSLRDRLERGPMSVDAAVELGRQLAATMGRAHERGIVHRDLKPENVLFDGAGTPHVADLGVARHVAREGEGARSAALSRTGAMLGTACYMAPEQLHDARRVGPPADVFALGQIVYECVTGVTPFQGETLQETLTRLVDGRLTPLREGAPLAPAWLEAVLARALDPDPAARWADGRALAQAFAARGRGERRRRARRSVAAAIAVGGGLGVVVVAAALAWPHARDEVGGVAPVPTTSTDTGTGTGTGTGTATGAATGTDTGTSADTGPADAPPTAAELVRRARARKRAGDDAGAIEDLERAITADPRHALAWRLLGMARRERME